MKIFITLTTIFFSSFLHAQKNYDCVVYTKNIENNLNKHRFVGQLTWIKDSSIGILISQKDTLFNWDELQTVKFRKHNGYIRTAIPAFLITSAAVAAVAYATTPEHTSSFLITSRDDAASFAFVGAFISCLSYGTPIYFVARNRVYKIKNYQDFKKLKSAASKFISNKRLAEMQAF